MTRVLIVDDHALFRQGLRRLLAEESDIEVVGEADGITSALEAVAALAPDIVTIDIRLGGVDGLQVASQIGQQHPTVKTVILTTFDDRQYLLRALQAGVRAYLLKNTSYDTLASTLRAVQAGQRSLAPELVHHVLDDYGRLVQEQRRRESGIGDQEVAVLHMLADGATSREIADQLFVSEITVKRKIQEITDKLGAANRVQAVAQAVRLGLIV